MEEYHTIADKAMEDLLVTLEELIESRGEADQEVDYHVREVAYAVYRHGLMYLCGRKLSERCAYSQSGPFWNVCHQQAAAEQADLAVFSYEVGSVLLCRFGYASPFCCRCADLDFQSSGPKRYDFHPDTKSWVYSRDNKTLDELLSEELSEVFGEQVKISL